MLIPSSLAFFIFLISALMAACWLELEQSVKLVEHIFVDIIQHNRGLAELAHRSNWLRNLLYPQNMLKLRNYLSVYGIDQNDLRAYN